MEISLSFRNIGVDIQFYLRKWIVIQKIQKDLK